MRRCISVFLGLLLLLTGCWTDDPTRHNTFVPVTAMELIPTYESMADKTVNQYRAIGDFSGSFTRDITSEVTWIVEDETIATVSNAAGSEGLVTAVAPGATTITALYGDFSQSGPVVVTTAFLTGIEIAPQDAELQTGLSQQYEAEGTFSDGSVQDITSLATWESSVQNVATIDNEGLAKAVDSGSTIISASWQGIEATASLMVVEATLTAITITPEDGAVAQGTALQYAAEGTYSDSSTQDITDQVAWQSTDTDIATIDAGGLAKAIAPGETEISASYEAGGETLSDTEVLTVTDAVIISISVTPADSTIDVGAIQRFKATGRFSDLTEQDITSLASWRVSNSSVGTISNTSGNRGEFTSQEAGATVIEANFDGVIGETLITVQ